MGERLGRYTVLKHLASGGMADVLLARTDGIEGFARHVVLKRIRSEHAKDRRFIEMFLDEARLAANLHHQNIVQVHDIGESGGEFFFAMEYLHGEDLRAMLSIVAKTRAHMPLGYVVSVMSSVAAGLHYAHERRGPDKKPLNIVHRDVSPSNILVGYDGSVKIVDFGIAKAAMRQVETRSGSLKGKVSYMSPEQCKSGTIDRRSDVYALGVVLYELATTTRLFKSDSDYLVMDAICTGKIPLPRVRRPDLPNELSTIIMTALATDPERRYQTADEMRIALDAFAATAGLTASASTIAAYVLKLCGEKPEPWLDSPSVDDKPTHDELARTTTTAAGEAKTITDGKARTPVPAPPPVAAAAAPTSTKLGWEQSVPPTASGAVGRGFTSGKIAMIVVPLLAIVGVLVWKLAVTPKTTSPVVAAAETATARPSSTVAVGVGPATASVPTEQPADPKPAVASATTKPTAKATPGVKSTDPKAAATATTPAVKPTDPKALAATTRAVKPPDPKPPATTTATAATTPGAKPDDKVTTTTAAKPVEPPAVSPVATTTTTTPPDANAPMAVLAPAAVEAVAARNRKALLACENNETLQGDLTVKFEIDADGRVRKSQLQSTLGKPNIATCILMSVRSWRFPKPPSGSASGVYSISFQ